MILLPQISMLGELRSIHCHLIGAMVEFLGPVEAPAA